MRPMIHIDKQSGGLRKPRARVLGVASYLPPFRRSSSEVEQLITESSPNLSFPAGVVETMTGVRSRRVADEAVNASDLAAAAARKLLGELEFRADEVDLLIFASASQDMLEPATANMVQEKVGTSCQVFDVKNACNSFLSGLDVAAALIASGSVRSALVTTGEVPSRSVKWAVEDRNDFKLSFPGYTLGDAGAAALLVRPTDERGIFHCTFQTLSKYWSIATIPGGGSAHPRGDEYSYFRSDGTALRDAFAEAGAGIVYKAFEATGTTFGDYRRILVHQVAMPFLRQLIEVTGAPAEKVEVTAPDLGNIASATLPVAFTLAHERGDISPGDNVLWIGLASGISLGVMCMRY
jgi:3-oxoacyl-[acyl-carrier-protein] synthase III